MGLSILAGDYTVILAQVEAAYPREACGLLAGRAGQVRRVYPVENVAPGETIYRMHPAQQVQALLDLEAAGLSLCGMYHSHPHGPAVLSATDIAQAAYPGVVQLILARSVAGWIARAFSLAEGRVTEVALVLADTG